MTRARRLVAGVALFGTAAMLVTACSGSDGGHEPLTINSVLGIEAGGVPDFDTQQQLIQELTAACMIDAGWDYIPVRYPDAAPLPDASGEDELARIKSEGLGYAYAVLSYDADAAAGTAPPTDFVDPNAAYVATLSEVERSAYDVSLYGTPEDQESSRFTTKQVDPSTGDFWSTTGSASGCSGESSAAVYTRASPQTAEQADAIEKYGMELHERVRADPRTIKLEETWAQCMSAAGFDYANPRAFADDAAAEFTREVNAVVDSGRFSDPTAQWDQDQIDAFFSTATEDEVKALYDTGSELTASERTGLEAILAEEVAVGLADYECRANLAGEAAEISADVEEQYVREHQDELTALAAAMGGEAS